MLNPILPSTLSSIKYEPPKTIAGRFVDQINQVEDAGIRKIVVDPSMMANMIESGLNSDVATLMSQMMGGGVSQPLKQSQTDSLSSEVADLMNQMIAQQKVVENPNAGSDMIRKRPDYIEKVIRDSEVKDKFLIDIENYTVLDLKVRKNNKNDVIERLKSLSKSNYENNLQEAIFYYTDIGLTFYFNENDLINEIEIDEKYKGSTNKGLKINDPLEMALEIYGNPRMKSAKGAIWSNFSILMRDRTNEIMLIRLKIRD